MFRTAQACFSYLRRLCYVRHLYLVVTLSFSWLSLSRSLVMLCWPVFQAPLRVLHATARLVNDLRPHDHVLQVTGNQ